MELVAGAGARAGEWARGDLDLDLEPPESGLAENGLMEPAGLVMAPIKKPSEPDRS